MAINLKQFQTFQSGMEALDRVQKHVSLAVDPMVKLLHSWKLALSPQGWLQHNGADLVDVSSEQTLTDKAFSGGTISRTTTITQPSWTAFTLNSPWSNWGAPFRSLSYKVDQSRNLWISGMVLTGADPGAFDVIGVLPVGARPANDSHAPLCRARWGGVDRNVLIQVYANGDVMLNEGAPGGAVTYLGINFSIPLD